MRWLALFALAACGRVRFDPEPVVTFSVEPAWAPSTGGDVVVTLAQPTDEPVLVDGVTCEAPQVTGVRIACRVPPHEPAIVDVTIGDASAPFRYLEPAPIIVHGDAVDASSGLALDNAGNTFVSGGTLGSLGGANAGDYDMVVAKLDPVGKLVWIRQLGSAAYDYARDVSVDPSGDVTLVGYTSGALDGANAGGNDVVVVRYSNAGDLRWVRQLGTAGEDQAWDASVDANGETVVAIRTTGAYEGTNAGGYDYAIARLAADGTVRWVHQGGSSADDVGHSVGVAPDGTAFLTGYTRASLEAGVANQGSDDLFVARYDADGTRAWIHQRGGAGTDHGYDVAIDDTGDVWIAGSTTGDLDGTSGTDEDVIVMRWSSDGTHRLTRRIGGPSGAQVTFGIAIAPDGGDVYLSGTTTGPFGGEPFYGDSDYYVASLTRDGDPRWTRIAGTAGSELGSSTALSPTFDGLVYVSIIVDDDLAIARFDTTGTLR